MTKTKRVLSVLISVLMLLSAMSVFVVTAHASVAYFTDAYNVDGTGEIKNTALLVDTGATAANDTEFEAEWEGTTYKFIIGTNAFSSVAKALASTNLNATNPQIIVTNHGASTEIKATKPVKIYAKNWNTAPMNEMTGADATKWTGADWTQNTKFNQNQVYCKNFNIPNNVEGTVGFYGFTVTGGSIYPAGYQTVRDTSKSVTLEFANIRFDRAHGTKKIFENMYTTGAYTNNDSVTIKNFEIVNTAGGIASDKAGIQQAATFVMDGVYYNTGTMNSSIDTFRATASSVSTTIKNSYFAGVNGGFQFYGGGTSDTATLTINNNIFNNFGGIATAMFNAKPNCYGSVSFTNNFVYNPNSKPIFNNASGQTGAVVTITGNRLLGFGTAPDMLSVSTGNTFNGATSVTINSNYLSSEIKTLGEGQTFKDVYGENMGEQFVVIGNNAKVATLGGYYIDYDMTGNTDTMAEFKTSTQTGEIKNTALLVDSTLGTLADGEFVYKKWDGTWYKFDNTNAFKSVALALASENLNATNPQIIVTNHGATTEIKATKPVKIYAKNWNTAPMNEMTGADATKWTGADWTQNTKYNENEVFCKNFNIPNDVEGTVGFYGFTVTGGSIYPAGYQTVRDTSKSVTLEFANIRFDRAHGTKKIFENMYPSTYTNTDTVILKNFEISADEGNTAGGIVNDKVGIFSASTLVLDGVYMNTDVMANAAVDTFRTTASGVSTTVKNSYFAGIKGGFQFYGGVTSDTATLTINNNIFNNFGGVATAMFNAKPNCYGSVSFTNNFVYNPNSKPIFNNASGQSGAVVTITGNRLLGFGTAPDMLSVSTGNTFNGATSVTINSNYLSSEIKTLGEGQTFKDVYGENMGEQFVVIGNNAKVATLGAFYSDYDMTTTGHTHVPGEWISDNNATCVTDGTKHQECTVDGCTYKFESVTDEGSKDNVEHTLGEWISDNNATCYADGTKHKECTVDGCDYATTPETDTGSKDSVEHTLGDWISDNNATCVTDGTKHKECTVNGCTYKTESVTDEGSKDSVEHTLGDWISDNNATCVADGTKHKECTVDGCDYATQSETDAGSKDSVEHTLGDWISDNNATCVTDGTKHKECTVNGCTYKTESVTDEGSKDSVEHTLGEWISDNNATCYADGTKHKECTVDGCTYKTESVTDEGSKDSIEHSLGDWISDNNATCVTDGTKHKECTVNGCTYKTESVTDAGSKDSVEHTLGEWISDNNATCYADGTKHKECTVDGCDYATTPETDTGSKDSVEHTLGDWISDNNATCAQDGTKHKECTVDGCDYSTAPETDTGSKDNIQHTWDMQNPTHHDANCVTDAYDEYACSVDGCTATYKDYEEGTAGAGHTVEEWTYNNDATCVSYGTESGECTVCHQIDTRNKTTGSFDANNHELVWVENHDATCTDNGTKYQDCTRDGCDYRTENVTNENDPAKDHTLGEWISDNNATCAQDGTKHKECTVDGCTYKTESVTDEGSKDSVEHTLGEWISDNNATCVTDGTKHKECTVDGCDYATTPETDLGSKDSVEHTLGDWISDNNATCVTDGTKHKECTVDGCDYATTPETDTGSKDNVEHTLGEWISDNNATCVTDGTKHKECTVDGCDYATTPETDLGSKDSVEHTLGDWISDNNATCVTDGTKHKECTVDGCDYATTPETDTGSKDSVEHTLGDWISDNNATCVADGTKHKECTVDGCDYATQSETDAGSKDSVEHTLGDWISDNNATCVTDGTKHKECTVDGCDYATTPETDLGSKDSAECDWDNGVRQNDATCFSNEHIIFTCVNCQTTETREIPDSTVKHQLGEYTHNGDATCTFRGTETAKCIWHKDNVTGGCEYTHTRNSETHAFGDHDWRTDGVSNGDATCTNDGTMTVKCKVCPELKRDVVEVGSKDPNKHVWGDWEYSANACSGNGTRTHACTLCGHAETEPFTNDGPNRVPHTFIDYIYNGDVTCIKDGTKTAKCEYCDATNTIKDDDHKKHGIHDYDEWYVATEPTCTVGVIKARQCTYPGCTHIESVEVENTKKPHTMGDYVYNNDATYTADGTKTAKCSVCGFAHTVTAAGTMLVPEVVDSGKFIDVKANDWFKSAVDYAVENGFVNGVSDKVFAPNDTITRGMFVTILARIAGVDTSAAANASTVSKFVDVKAGQFYSAAVVWATNNGVVNGYDATTFMPNDAITRQQLCTMIVRCAKALNITLAEHTDEVIFADANSIMPYAKEAVAICQKAGIVKGYLVNGGYEFRPSATATRAEAVTMLTRFHQDFVLAK